MATAAWHALGSVPGRCTSCHVVGRLWAGEARYHRTLLERLKGGPAPRPLRMVACDACQDRRVEVPAQRSHPDAVPSGR